MGGSERLASGTCNGGNPVISQSSMCFTHPANAARPRDEDYDAVRTRPTQRKKKRRLERDVENNHPAKKKANKEMIYSLGRMTSVRNSVINKPSNGFCSPRCRRGEAASPE